MRFVRLLISVGAVSGAMVLFAAAPALAGITNNTTTKIVTMTGTGYSMAFSYNAQAVITSLQINGVETLDTAQGIYSAVYKGPWLSGTWITSQSLTTSPTVTVVGSTVTATFTTSVASETWTFTVNSTNVVFALSRTYNAAYTGTNAFSQQGTPMINFSQNTVESIRWPDDGGAFPIANGLLNTYQQDWLATGSQLDTNVRVGEEQPDFTVLNSATSPALALKVTGTTSNDGLSRGRATELYRAGGNDLRMSLVTSAAGLQYRAGDSLGLGFFGHYQGEVCPPTTCSPGGAYAAPIYAATSTTSGEHDTVTLTFTPDTYSNYYNLGTLKGVDAGATALAINNLGRWMMQDVGRGSSTEASIAKMELPPFEQKWLAQVLGLFPDSNAITAFKAGLSNIAQYQVNTSTGQIECCAPGLISSTYSNYEDNAPQYAIAAADAYAMSGDTAWLTSMSANVASAVNGGLQYLLGNTSWINTSTFLVKNATTVTIGSGGNDYWEMSQGTYNGYLSALLYQALEAWAPIEANVVGNTTLANTYLADAATLATNYNKSLANGGLWSPTSSTFYYGSGSPDALYLPVQSTALEAGIASHASAVADAQAIEAEALSHNAGMHAMNYVDDWTSGGGNAPACNTANNQGGENGGWYGAPDGDFYAAFPLLNDREKISTYIANFNNRYYADGFYGQSAWDPNNWTAACGFEAWFPTTVMPLWGLYTYGYGFQPQYNQLNLAPFIGPTMVGSVVNYTWRGASVTVTYNSEESFTVNAASLPTNIAIKYINQTPNATYHVSVDGGTATAITADSSGTVTKVDSTTGSHTFACTDCTTSDSKMSGTSAVTSWSPGTTTTRDDVTTQVGMKFTVGSSPITITDLGRWVASLSSKEHTLKLEDSSNHILGQTAMDVTGTADGNGFVYAPLARPVELQANTSYYLYSTELAGGDLWYDCQVTLSSTADVTVNGGYYGNNIAGCPSTGNSYGPVNFKYYPGLVKTATLGTLRNDVTNTVGTAITVGSNPITVHAIGRYYFAGDGTHAANSGSHQLSIISAATGLALTGSAITLNTSVPLASTDGYKYAVYSSPITLSANTTYYIVSDETASGDYWYDADTTATTTPDVTANSAVFKNGSSWTVFSSGHTYGPVNILYTR